MANPQRSYVVNSYFNKLDYKQAYKKNKLKFYDQVARGKSAVHRV